MAGALRVKLKVGDGEGVGVRVEVGRGVCEGVWDGPGVQVSGKRGDAAKGAGVEEGLAAIVGLING